MKNLLENLGKLKTSFADLPIAQKILYTGSLFILLGSLAFLFYSMNKPDYGTLYSRLAEEDMAAVVQTLKNRKIPYQLSGNSISVPKEQLSEVRLAMATQGIPKGSGVGFEIFDQQKLGSTEFVQKINYQRALQGELARTINQMDEVQESRIHLVLPSDSLFVEDKKPPSAAVVLKLKPGARLEQQRVQGIVNLVASAVQGLQEDKISILSTDGQVLFKKNPMDTTFQLTSLQMQMRNNVEEDLRRKVQSLIEQVVGANRATTRVTVDLDFDQMQVTEDKFDPESTVVRSQQRSVENSAGELGPKGNPDAPINTESQLMQSGGKDQQQAGQQGKGSSRQRETVNYEINRVSKQISHAPGSVKKLSVAVLVDGPYEMKPNKDNKPVATFVGRTPEQIKALEEIVRKAVGYNEARGDQINVSNIAFATEPMEPDLISQEKWYVKLLKENQKIIFNLLLTVLVYFFIVRPFMKRFRATEEDVKALPGAAGLEGLPDGMELPILADQLPEKELSIRQQAIELVKQDPEQATAIIRSMLREEA